MDLFLLGQSEGQRKKMIVARRKQLFNLLFREREKEKRDMANIVTPSPSPKELNVKL